MLKIVPWGIILDVISIFEFPPHRMQNSRPSNYFSFMVFNRSFHLKSQKGKIKQTMENSVVVLFVPIFKTLQS